MYSYPKKLSGNNYLLKCGSHYTHCELTEDGFIRVIECDIKEKWMKMKERRLDSLEWNSINEDEIERDKILDLNENGERWEGDTLFGNPFGFGCIYNSENQLIYKGFVIGEMKVCFGSDYFGDVEVVNYEGDYYKNMRYGYGKLYNKKKELIYEGEWKDNQSLSELSTLQVDSELDENAFHFGLEEIIIGENVLEKIEFFRLIGFNHLKKVEVKKNNLDFMRLFCIEDCNELVDVQLQGNDSYYCNDDSIRLFRIRNCSQLIKIIIGCGWYTCHVHIEFIGIE